MILYPNAKINLGLNILNKRSDGFHEIDTLMYPVPLTDIITINKSVSDKTSWVNFSSTGLNIDGKPENNLIVKAYELLNADFNLPAVDIHLHKTIPFGAGLGGGSGDCAFTLVGLNKYFSLGISLDQLESYAAELGSDCAFFVKNIPAFSRGRGELLTPVSINLSNYKLALVIPNVGVSTQEAYGRICPKTPKVNLENIVLQKSVDEWRGNLVNDFEDSVFAHKPEIKNIKEELYNLGAVYASMSGSGSAVFALFKNKIQLKEYFPDNYFVWMD